MIKGNYNLLINTAYIDYKGDESVEIAKIVDITSNKDVMYIDYEKNLYSTHGYHMCVDVYESSEGDFPVAKVDDNHRLCLIEHPDVFITLILHELGHFLNGDFTDASKTNKEIQEERMRCILDGKIQDIERKADYFAFKQVGRNTFIRAMDYLIAQRKKRKDRDMLLAIKEFEIRKAACKKYK